MRKTSRPHSIESLEVRRLLSTVTWVNPVGGDWDTAANWQDDLGANRLPGTGDDAVINVAGGATVFHSTNVVDQVRSLAASSPVRLSAGVLDVTATLSSSAAFTLSGGTLRHATTTSGTNLASGSGGTATLDGVTVGAGGSLALVSDDGFFHNFNVINGLTVNGQFTVGYLGRLFVTGDQSFDGSGEMFLSDDTASLNLNQSGMTLTLGHDLRTRGGLARVQNNPNVVPNISGTTLVNHGLIQSNTFNASGGGFPIAVDSFVNASDGRLEVVTAASGLTIGGSSWLNQGTATLTAGVFTVNASQWSNPGRIVHSGGTLNLGGHFSRATLGTLDRAGGTAGTVNLKGVFDNANDTLLLSTGIGGWGTWILAGGRIVGGTVATRDGAQLLASHTSPPGTLDGVTLAQGGDLVLAGPDGNVNDLQIVNGLTVEGRVTLGSLGRLYATGTQTIDGHGEIVFTDFTSDLLLNQSNMTLTLGPSLRVHGSQGNIANRQDFPAASNTTVVNQGSVQNDYLGIVGALTVGVSHWINAGALRLRPSAILDFAAPLAVEGSGLLETQVGGTLSLRRGLTGSTTDADHFAPRGLTRFDGTGSGGAFQMLEAMSRDRGATAAGFDRNFAYGAVSLVNGANVRLADSADNAAGSGSEAVYAQSLLVSAGATLDLNGRTVYARAARIDGTVVGGSVVLVADGGELQLGVPTPGAIASAGQVDDWTFFGRAGQSLRAVVAAGANSPTPPFDPGVDNAQVQVLDPHGAVLATAVSSPSANAVLSSVSLPEDGLYTIRVQATPSHPAGAGSYLLTAWDATVRTTPLTLNQATHDSLASIYAVDRWTFSAAANQQVRLDRLSADPGLLFDLSGPGGFNGFSGLTTSSGLVTLPASGVYTLTVRSSRGADGGYSFRLNQTTETPLALGATYNGVTPGTGFAQLFRVDVPTFTPLLINFDGANNNDRIEVYARQGSPPTRQDFAYRNPTAGADHEVPVPSGVPGTWYVLVYADAVASPSAFALRVDATSINVLDAAPHSLSNTAKETLTLRGLGFLPGTQVQLIPQGEGAAIAAQQVFVDSTEQVTATFDLSAATTGAYDVRATLPGGSGATLVGKVSVAGGTGHLETLITTPAQVGRAIPATLYVEYANTGTAAMPAPILIVKSGDADDSDKPLLTLDKNRVIAGAWTSAVPDGFAHSVQIYAQGALAGILQPGERVRVPVYYGGFQGASDGSIEFAVYTHEAGDATVVDWAGLSNQLKPDWIQPDAWAAIYANLQAQVGSTWGDYVRTLSGDSAYLQRLGQPTADVDRLYGFELLQAMSNSPVTALAASFDASLPTPGLTLNFARSFGDSINERHRIGPFGRGWNATAQRSLEELPDGTVIVHESADSQRRFQPDSRGANSYFSQTSDTGKLRKIPGVGYELTELNGMAIRFLADGRFDAIQHPSGVALTAGYSSGRLASLTHSSGASLSFTYNAAGRVVSVADSAGRTTTYAYDASNEHLLTVSGPAGTTTYTYSLGQGAAREHALISITDPSGVTRFFSYDTQGRLSETHASGNLQPTTFIYGGEGQVTVVDGSGATSELSFDGDGFLVKGEDSTGHYVRSQFDDHQRLVQTADATGRNVVISWTRSGALASITDALNQTTTFAPGGPLNQRQSFTDARGNVTRHAYDAKGNLVATTYADATIERATYDANGTPDVTTNRRGQTIDRTVNAAGQVTHETRSGGTFVDYAYNARGRLTTATDASGATTMTYDDADRLTRIEYPNGRWLQYAYDAAGRRTRIEDQTGFATNYEYDSSGRLKRLRDGNNALIVEYTYDVDGRLTFERKGNGTVSFYTYDAAGRTASIIHYASIGGAVNAKFVYTYDAAGRRISQETLDGKWTYEYDLVDQLTRAAFDSTNPSFADQDLRYAYDALGNRTRTILNGVTTDYAANGMNQYTSAGATTFHYDLDGNLVEESGPDGLKRYAYDVLNRLTRVETPQGVWEYEYDALGNRAAVVKNGQRTEFLVDPTGLEDVTGEYGPGGTLAAHYTRGLALASRVDAAGANFYDFDSLGSAAGLTGAGGAVLNQYSYLPFGGLLHSTGTASNPFTFIGGAGVMDDGNALSFMRARKYSPSQGRFVQADPIRLTGGDGNYYRYVSNNPIEKVDPSGLVSVSPDASCSGGLTIGCGVSIGPSVGIGIGPGMNGAGLIGGGCGISFGLGCGAGLNVDTEYSEPLFPVPPPGSGFGETCNGV